MTTAQVRTGAGRVASVGSAPPPWSRAAAARRLARLFLAGRGVPLAAGALIGCAVALHAALEWHWIPTTGPLTQQLPVVLEAGTASVIAATTYSPFGEAERATGRWLPYLRFGTAAVLTGMAIGLLSAGSVGAHLPGGTLEVVRNVAGIAGIGLLAAAGLGGGLSWIGPMAFLALSENAIVSAWRTPWIWPARPSHDIGAALCAALLFVGGVALSTALGGRRRWAE